jgi:hypothetical protein
LVASTRIQAQAKGVVNIIAPPPTARARKRKALAADATAPTDVAADGAAGQRFPILGFNLEAGPFELVADGLDAVRAEGQRLAAARGRADRELAAAILGGVVPLLEGRQEAAERLARARARIAKTLGLGGGGGGAIGGGGSAGGADPPGRGRRARAPVMYAIDEYDKRIAVSVAFQGLCGLTSCMLSRARSQRQAVRCTCQHVWQQQRCSPLPNPEALLPLAGQPQPLRPAPCPQPPPTPGSHPQP